MEPGARAAWANRTASAAIVGAYLAASAHAVPDADARAALHYAVVTAAGYGHLLGAARLPGRGLAGRASFALALANALALYGLALERLPEIVLLLLAASAWHAVENDLGLAAAYARGHSLPPHPRGARALAACAAATAVVVAAATAALAERAARSGRPARVRRRVRGRDAPPSRVVRAAPRRARACARTLRRAPRGRASPRASPRGTPSRSLVLALLPRLGAPGTALHAALVAPPLYLFFSVLHVVQTGLRRG